MFRHIDHFCAGREGHRHFGGGGRGGFFGGSVGGGFRGGGPGMRTAKMLASGDLQLIILLLLSEKPRHGYEIIKAVEEHSSADQPRRCDSETMRSAAGRDVRRH